MKERTLLNTLLEERELNISGGIYHKLQVDFAYNSNHIEGSRLTHEQTRFIFETQTIGEEPANVNDIIETVNHFRCFDYILDSINFTLSEDYIKSLHRMLKTGVMIKGSSEAVIGDYKKYPNVVGIITTANPNSVSHMMQKLLSNYNSLPSPDLYDIAEFHIKFEHIHPFYDGNGRIGRLLMFKQCLENNIVPFIISDETKRFYYKGLQEWQTQNMQMRLIDTFLDAQDNMKAVLNYFDIKYDPTFTTARQILDSRTANYPKSKSRSPILGEGGENGRKKR